MTQEELQAIRAMMEEVTQASEKRTDEKLAGITERLDTMQTDITAMQGDIAEIKEDTTITRSATNSLVKWADDVSVLTQIKFPINEAK